MESLLEDEILTDNESKEILQIRNRREQNRKFYCLLHQLDEWKFDKFLKKLGENDEHKHVCNTLKESMAGILVVNPSIDKKKCLLCQISEEVQISKLAEKLYSKKLIEIEDYKLIVDNQYNTRPSTQEAFWNMLFSSIDVCHSEKRLTKIKLLQEVLSDKYENHATKLSLWDSTLECACEIKNKSLNLSFSKFSVSSVSPKTSVEGNNMSADSISIKSSSEDEDGSMESHGFEPKTPTNMPHVLDWVQNHLHANESNGTASDEVSKNGIKSKCILAGVEERSTEEKHVQTLATGADECLLTDNRKSDTTPPASFTAKERRKSFACRYRRQSFNRERDSMMKKNHSHDDLCSMDADSDLDSNQIVDLQKNNCQMLPILSQLSDNRLTSRSTVEDLSPQFELPFQPHSIPESDDVFESIDNLPVNQPNSPLKGNIATNLFAQNLGNNTLEKNPSIGYSIFTNPAIEEMSIMRESSSGSHQPINVICDDHSDLYDLSISPSVSIKTLTPKGDNSISDQDTTQTSSKKVPTLVMGIKHDNDDHSAGLSRKQIRRMKKKERRKSTW